MQGSGVPFWLWSWLLTAVGVTGLWVAGSNKRWGWLIGLGAQVLWIAYAVATRQYGFIASALVYATVYGRNFWHGRRTEQSPAESHQANQGARKGG